MDFAGTKMQEKNTDCITADDVKDFSTKGLMKMFPGQKKKTGLQDVGTQDD